MKITPMDTIEVTPSHTSMVGRKAVEVFRLAALVSGLKLELKCPGLRMSRHMSALQAAKTITGLRTNDRNRQLARAELMLAQAKTEVLYVDAGDEKLLGDIS